MKMRLLLIMIVALSPFVAHVAQAEELVRKFSGSRTTETADFDVKAPWLIDWIVNSEYPDSMGLAVALVIVWHLGQRERSRLQEAIVGRHARQEHTKQFAVKSEVQDVFKSKHLKLIAAMTVATFITVPLIDY